MTSRETCCKRSPTRTSARSPRLRGRIRAGSSVARILCAGLLACGAPSAGAAVVRADEAESMLRADDRDTIRRIVRTEGLDAPPERVDRGWPLRKGETGVRYAAKENPRHALTVVPDADGRVAKYLGNGPLLSNASCGELARLGGLRVIRIDHNIPGPGDKRPHEDYDGSGFAALAGSLLEEVRIGHAFDDDGMTALAKVRSLRSVQVVHGKVTDRGLRALADHPHLETFHVSSQGRPERVTEKCLAVFATLPKLRELGLHETFATYEGGLRHLAGAKALATLSLKGSLVLPADVEKLRKDRPELVVETSTPAEILESPNSRGVARWATPEAQEYLKSGAKE